MDYAQIKKTEKFISDKLPSVGDKSFCDRKIRIVAVGVRIKQQPVTGKIYYDLDSNYFVFAEKNEYYNGMIAKK
jgi:hypothetical protein